MRLVRGRYSEGWVRVPSMLEKRAWTSACCLDGRIYVFGGRDGSYRTLRTCESFGPETQSWKSIASMPKPRFGHESCALGRHIYILGGYEDSFNLTASVLRCFIINLEYDI